MYVHMCTCPLTPIKAKFSYLYVGRGGVKALGSQKFVRMCTFMCTCSYMIVSLVMILVFPQVGQKVPTPPPDPLPPKKGGHVYTRYRVAVKLVDMYCMHVQ